MENPIEIMNDELVQQVENEMDEKEDKKENVKEIRKNSKKDIVARIFQVCEMNNFKINETETQLLRKTRKALLEILAGYIEKSMENKIKSEENGIPRDCQESNYASQLPMLRLAHGFMCNLLQKGFNAGAGYLDYSYELKDYSRICNQSLIVDQCLIDIANEYGDDLFMYFANPYYRLLFVHITSMMSCIHYIDKEQMKSPRVKFDKLNV